MMEKCLASGPWVFAGHVLFLKQWKVGMPLSKEGHKTFSMWINLYNVPVEYWTPLGLNWIASAVGKPIHLDPNTVKMERLNFARVCVDVQADAELPSKIKLHLGQNPVVGLGSNVEVVVEYQRKPVRCGNCRKFGHNASQCISNNKTQISSLFVKDEKCSMGQEGVINSSLLEAALASNSYVESSVISSTTVLQDAEEPCLLVGSAISAQAADNWGRKLSPDYEADGRVSNSVVPPDWCLTDEQKLRAPDGVSMAHEDLTLPAGFSSVDRLAGDCKLEFPAISAEVQCPTGSTPMDKSEDGAAAASSIGTDLVGDQGLCLRIGKLMKTIDEIRMKFGDYRARVPINYF